MELLSVGLFICYCNQPSAYCLAHCLIIADIQLGGRTTNGTNSAHERWKSTRQGTRKEWTKLSSTVIISTSSAGGCQYILARTKVKGSNQPSVPSNLMIFQNGDQGKFIMISVSSMKQMEILYSPVTIHGCGQIKVDGNILISFDACSGQNKNNSEENKSRPTAKFGMDYIRRTLIRRRYQRSISSSSSSSSSTCYKRETTRELVNAILFNILEASISPFYIIDE